MQELWRRVKENGYIYKGSYTGQYCVFDELYVDGIGPGDPCPECGRPTETIKEENYFFKLSAFAEPLLDLYLKNPDFIRPETRRNEVIAFVRSGLRDLSISRSTFSWGIPVPDDPKHVIYVWVDALANYITALGYGQADDSQYKKYWPADVHMIGKEIVRFHCVYWPAWLMAARLPLPKSIVAHGWLLFEESKMSKSRGNIVRTETILDVLGADALRYFLLREVVFGQDGSFSFDALVQRYNSDLANGLGNLASRTLAMITRYFKGEVPYPSHAAHKPADDAIAKLAEKTIADFHALFEQYQFSRALETAWQLVAAVDKYIVENEPWSLAEKQDETSRARLATVLYTSAEALRIVTVLAHPVMPEGTARIWGQLGLGEIEKFPLADLHWGQLHLGTKLGRVEPVFPRADKSAIERMQKMEDQERTPAAETATAVAAPPAAQDKDKEVVGRRASSPGHPESGSAPQTPAQPTQPIPPPISTTPAAAPAADSKITIDDFAKVELRVAQIKVAEKVKGADKLLRLEVDLGTETRQIVAGIAEAYAPETLIGRKVVIVANLAPRKLRGLESNGMIVAASLEGGKPVLAAFLEDVPVGARLK
jgi:methionyl-tRNA synthetase